MFKFLKRVVLPSILALSLCFVNVMSVFAVSSSKGGTWVVEDIVSDVSIWDANVPKRIVYLPYSVVKAIHNGDLDENLLEEVMIEYGSQALTTALVKEISKKYALNLTPYVGWGFLTYDICKAIIQNQHNKLINKAYRNKCGIKYTVSTSYGNDAHKYSIWKGKSMPEKIYLEGYSGYVTGSVTIGEYNFK